MKFLQTTTEIDLHAVSSQAIINQTIKSDIKRQWSFSLARWTRSWKSDHEGRGYRQSNKRCSNLMLSNVILEGLFEVDSELAEDIFTFQTDRAKQMRRYIDLHAILAQRNVPPMASPCRRCSVCLRGHILPN